ncbi:DUF1559 domain-containing protein [Symmachiella dynata]|uniref:DUF1559 family PulG-like putative transporter n=1 Tax=Symmachiella dynata TaxID=2527995 RepID=UPI0030EC2D01
MTDHPDETGVEFADVQPSKQKFTLIEGLVTMSIIALLIALISPAKRSAREAARRTQCINHLKNIGLALHNYANEYGAFPPAYSVDAHGKPLHSWRTLILPYLDQRPLYERIDLTKPWDDPANAESYATELRVFQCPSAKLGPQHTVYLAVTAQDGFFREDVPRKLTDVTGDPHETLMVIEAPSQNAVHWMSPYDADERVVLSLTKETELHHPGDSVAVFVDGTVRAMSATIPESELRRMISIAGDDDREASP